MYTALALLPVVAQFEGETTGTIPTALSNFSTILTSVINTIEGQPLMLTAAIIPLIGAAVGMFKRLV